MSMNETIPVTFLNKEGIRLFGMYHRPMDACPSGTTVLLLSPGVKTRVAPHRMYVKMVGRFLELGYPVLRFDFYGLGDSEGEVKEEYLADVYGSIQAGRYVRDTLSAMDWMQSIYGTSQFIVSGLCGGALTGLLAAVEDKRIIGLIGLSVPVILDGTQIDYAKHMTDAHLGIMRAGYMRKLWSGDAWQAWTRLLTFQSDYKLIARSILKPVIARLRGISSLPQLKQADDNTNPAFAPAFFKMVSSSRYVFFVFAEMDRLYWEYGDKFVKRYARQLEVYQSWYEVHVTKQANHIFSFPEWEQDMLNQCSVWLRRLRTVVVAKPSIEGRDEICRTIT